MDEIELTFLPSALPDLSNCQSKDMLDIYIPESVEQPILRVRKIGEKYEITKKERVGTDASHHIEKTIPLTRDEYDDLQKLPGKRIVKTRYFYQQEGVEYEIDVFKEKLQGLVLIDVEFTSHNDKQNFSAPEWLGQDITQQDFIAGANLCGKSYEDIEQNLQQLQYSPIK